MTSKIEFDDSDRYTFARNGSPLWIVAFADPADPIRRFKDGKDAEDFAADLAFQSPGERVFVLAAVASFQTSPKVIGSRFDHSKRVPVEVEEDPMFAEVDEPAPPACEPLNPPMEF